MTYSEWLMLPYKGKQRIAASMGLTIDGAEEYIRQMSKEDDSSCEDSDYDDYSFLDEDSQERIAEREGFTDRYEYSDYLWAMDKED